MSNIGFVKIKVSSGLLVVGSKTKLAYTGLAVRNTNIAKLYFKLLILFKTETF